MSDCLKSTIDEIKPVSKESIAKAYERLDSLTKPKRSLGYLEELAARYVAIRGEIRPIFRGKKVFVFAGDHKVVEEGVSAYPADVTGLMVMNFIHGGAAINVLARCAGAEVEIIDIGMAKDPGNLKGLLRLNVKRSADNIAKGPAMTIYEAKKAVSVGIERLNFAANTGVTLVATGEMGIGNTTPAAALYAAYLGLPVSELVGPGTGLDVQGIAKKTKIIEKALEVNRSRCTGPIETLAALGGLEIAGICGLCLGAAARRIPVVVDGYISTAGALVAMTICPAAKDYMFFSHMSAEPGHKKFFETENLRPVLDLGMRLGEGTGAVMAMQIIQDAVAIYNEMATFADVGITPGA
ncbi:MAG: nicotinate-nucleotide--dimethylbenzimidazole phosphoribosyltransferase [Kiritimatiellae bacterium]|nr:nicotinate-nucleotide--dimethylbenzimidazole phosphoribosyltransferase [Kiritimatiellia bacterium]MDD5521399.1 nicotinate-nucleotide--dimethylbenzimidazole phosphoribosyltransferase [Kiritimatiellia bacterium]